MRAIEFYLDDRDARELEEWSRERGYTKSEAVGLAIRALTSRSGQDPGLDLTGHLDGLPAPYRTRRRPAR
jgi:hypothetical protein